MWMLRPGLGLVLLAAAAAAPSAAFSAGDCRLLDAGRSHEQAGRLDEAAVYYRQAAMAAGCEPARPELARLARRFAAEAEKQGRLYSETPVLRLRADAKCGQCLCDGEGCEIPKWCATLPYLCSGEYRLGVDPSASAFAWFREAGDHGEADRVLVRLVRSRPQDLGAFSAAHRHLVGGASRGDAPPPKPEHLRELEGVAAKNGDALLAEEARDSEKLPADAFPAPDRSLETLERARTWLAFVPGGEAKVAARAVQRADRLAASEAPAWMEAAVMFYDFARADAKRQALQARAARLGDAALRAGSYGAAQRYYQIAGADDKAAEAQRLREHKLEASPVIKEKDDAARADFQKGKDALEKELDF